jgi:hypothetical protein
MATIHLPIEFKEFLQLLNARKVDYLVVGGYPVSYYGYARSTADIDVWIRTTKKNAALLSRALVDFGFDQKNVRPELLQRKGRIFRIGVPPLRIDILTDISGVTFSKCFAGRTVAKIDGISVNIISLKDLKKNKKASGRLKDLDDLENLP